MSDVKVFPSEASQSRNSFLAMFVSQQPSRGVPDVKGSNLRSNPAMMPIRISDTWKYWNPGNEPRRQTRTRPQERNS